MGDTKLLVLLLLYAIIFTEAQGDDAVCHLAKIYKSFHKYEYLYETESLNTLNGAVNGPKISCKVEIEVPGTCHFIVHTKECTLSEVISVDADENPVFGPTAGSETFSTQMEKYPLKVIVEGDKEFKLFPEDDELINILNIKRGIISALAVPSLQEKNNKKMPTIYGLCKTDYTVNAREDIPTDVTLKRDLSKCDQFRPIKDHTSPLAIITGLHYPLAQLIRSQQTCGYRFDNELKHMTSGVCTETHLLVPFSYKEKYGVTSVSKQTLSLLEVTEYNERIFDHKEANMKTLHLDESVDMSPNQDENVILAVLRELSDLSQTTHGQKRAHLAHKLVAVIRKMNAETLSAALPEALKISSALTYQALFQCGTPECSSALMQVFRTWERSVTIIDAAVYAMGMVSNPSRVLVKEMLEMAKFKQSKLIYYATSNAVRRLYKAEGKVTAEIQAVADYALKNIGDCTGDQEHIYLTLRVIGNMAEALGAASPALKSAVVQCIDQPAASTDVQQAAIQVFRLTPIPEEGRTVLMQVLLDGAAPVKKRVVAYLILMKDPQSAELVQLVEALPKLENLQVKSFVISHLSNILSSTAQETNELRLKILGVLQDNEVGNVMDGTKFSRNYKIGPLEGNMIFNKENSLLSEVMLEMTLSCFGYDTDMVEVGMEGKGLEPTVEALFGPQGFFPDTVMKTIYYTADKMPSQINEILKNMIPDFNDRKQKQGPKNIITEISKNVEKLMRNLAQDAPEGNLYMRLLGAELGYLKTKDFKGMFSFTERIEKILMRMFFSDFVKSLLSKGDLFLHYIFMDNEFYLPTGPGLPLRVALSGTFTPGVKGLLNINSDMSEISFMPAAGIEFVTEIGAHFPDYVNSGLEMHTSIYHESGMRAKVAMTKSQIKLTIPAPQNPVKVLSVSNSMISVAGEKTKSIPAISDRVESNKCTPLFAGMKYCNVYQYSNARLNDASPYFPLSGDSKFAIELHPTGDVSAYTATINYLYEDNIDKVTFDVKAEGTTLEAESKLMFNRKEYTVSSELLIPDYDIAAGIRIGAADPITKSKGTHSIQIDFINKNIPQASLVGLAKIVAMKDALLEVKLLVPSLKAEAEMSAKLKHEEELTLELESDLKLLNASTEQKLTLKYDHEKVEAKIESDFKTPNLISNNDIKHFLDLYIGQSEMQVRDALANSIQVTNSYLQASKIPYVKELRIPSLPNFAVPDKLFVNFEADAEYHFGKQYYTISLPMPLGGKSTKDLNFPPALTTPNMNVPQLGLKIDSIKVPLPELFVPKTLTLSLPTLGKAEVAGKLKSNLYDLEATASAGRDSDEQPSYSVKVAVNGTGPIDLLSIKINGSALISGTITETLKAEMSTAVTHKLINARFKIADEIQLTEKVSIQSTSMFEALNPYRKFPTIPFKVSLEHTGQLGVNIEEVSGESQVKGSFMAGPIVGDVTLMQSLALLPFKSKAKVGSTLEIKSEPFQAQNKIEASVADGTLSIVSTSAAFKNMLTHNAEVTLTRSKYAVKSDTKAFALGLNIHNIAEANIGPEDISMKIETTSGNSEDHINSLFAATLNNNGLVVNSNASVKLAEHTATHQASVILDKNGLTTHGFTSVNCLLTLQNTFNGILHSSKFSLSSQTKGEMNRMLIDNSNSMTATMSSVDITSKSRLDIAENVWYLFDISAQAEPYTASAGVSSHLKLGMNTELKNNYEVKLSHLSGTAKFSTTGKLMGAHISQDTEMEIVGLGIRVNNDASLKSQPVQFTSTIRATAVPFNINLNALSNCDVEFYLYGKHSAQVYNKILLKAEPFAFAHSHESRFSTMHEADQNIIFKAEFDRKIDTQLSVSEQSASVITKSKINNNLFRQELRAYNNPEKIGLEVSGAFIYEESQDYSVSALLQYDKNAESHVINLPLLESLPTVLENLRITTINLIEALQEVMKKEEFVLKIQTLLQHFTERLSEFNLDEKAEQIKKSLIAFVQDCPITTEQLKVALSKLRTVTLKVIAELNTHAIRVRKSVLNGAMTVMQKVTSLSEEYDIRRILLSVIEAIENVIKQIDTTQLKENHIPVFSVQDLNFIKLHLEQYVADLKDMVAKFDRAQFMQNIITTTEMYTEQLLANFPTEDISKISNTLKQLITELDIIDQCKVIYSNMRDIVIKYELDKRAEEMLDKLLELIKQFKIDETIRALGNILKSIPIPFPEMLDDALTYLKTTDIKMSIDNLNNIIEDFANSLKSFEYNAFVDEVNQNLSELTEDLNSLIVSLELSKKLEAMSKFLNYVLSSMSAYLEQLRSGKISDVIKPVTDLIDTFVLNNIKTIFKALKQHLVDTDIRRELLQALQQVKEHYNNVLSVLTNAYHDHVETATKILGDQQIVTELKQIIHNVYQALTTFEIEIPSFTIPLTDLVIPSSKFSLQQLQEAELPVHLHIPRFTILGSWTVPEITFTYDDIKEILIFLSDIIINLKTEMIANMIYIGKLPENLPDLPTFKLPEVTLPHISLPAIPKFIEKYNLDIPQIPEIKLPRIPNTLILPALGKLQGKIKVNSPIYVLSTSIELHNSTDKEQKHNFIAHFISEGISTSLKVLSYNLDATLRIGLPKMSRVIIADTLKFTHSALSVEQQASVTLYGISAQATALTNLKVTTTPYSAGITNKAFFAVEGGMTASSQTSYEHQVNIPFLSLTSEATLSQSAVLSQNGNTITVKVGNSGKGKFALSDYSDKGSHKSELSCTITPTKVTLTFNGDTDSATLKLKEKLDVDARDLDIVEFKGSIETQSPFIKNSLMEASGKIHLARMKIDMEATHNTELIGSVSGTLSNTVNVKVCPTEINVDIQNNGNAKVSLQESLSMNCGLQNNYTLILNSMKQYINTAALIDFSQHKYSYNFTVANNDVQTGVYAALYGETDLEFLNVHFNIPKMYISVIDLTIPAINDVNLYEITGLKYLYNTKPAIDVDAKIIYQTSSLISEMFLKSSIIDLITNARIYGDNDLGVHIAAAFTTVFNQLSAELEGTSSLTLKRGLKLANGLSLRNAFIEGAHNSTLTVNTETLEAALAGTTDANINLPMLTTTLNHNLLADTKKHPIAESTLMIKQKYNIPIIKAAGNGATEHTLKVDVVASSISIESTTKGGINGQFLETGTVKGELNNEATMYMSGEQLRSKLKTIGNVNVNRGDLKVEFDVNENLDMEMELDSVHTAMDFVSNNEVNIANFNTKGKHVAKAVVDLKKGSIAADVEFDLSQPTSLGNFLIFEKTLVDLTLSKQMISYSTKMNSPLYTTNIVIDMEGNAPVFKVAFKSSTKSPFVLLEHDLDSYLSTAIENEVLSVKAKAFLEHNDCTIDFSSVFIPSYPDHTVNVDITSTTFTDMHLRYAAQREGLTASISLPSVGFLGYQLQGKIPSELTSRLYGQCVSAPENDIDIINVKVAANEDKKIHFQADYNLEAPVKLILGLKERVPAITSAITNFAKKHGILGAINRLKITLVTALTEAYTISYNNAPDLRQLSVLFRNVVVQKQKAFQHVLNAVVTFLRDTQIKLPGMKEATLPEICQQIRSSIVVVVEEFINAIYNNLKPHFLQFFKSIRIALAEGEVLTGDEILGYMENALTHSVNTIKQMESTDVIIEKLGQALQRAVEKTQNLTDMIRSDFLDDVAAKINTIYVHYSRIVKRLIQDVNAMVNTEGVNAFVDECMNFILLVVKDFKDIIATVFPTGPDAKHSVTFQNGTLKMNFSIPLNM